MRIEAIQRTEEHLALEADLGAELDDLRDLFQLIPNRRSGELRGHRRAGRQALQQPA